MKILFIPDQARDGLPLDAFFLCIGQIALQTSVEFVRLLAPGIYNFVEIAKGWRLECGGESQPQFDFDPGGNSQWKVYGALRTASGAVDGGRVAANQIIVEGVLEVPR